MTSSASAPVPGFLGALRPGRLRGVLLEIRQGDFPCLIEAPTSLAKLGQEQLPALDG